MQVTLPHTIPEMASTDRDALLTLFYSTRGERWHKNGNWGTDAELSQWQGVTVNYQGRVVELDLSNSNLRGIHLPALLARVALLLP